MKNTLNAHFSKMIILLAVFLHMSAVLMGAEDNALRSSAKEFVRQICAADLEAILRTYSMTDEFKTIASNADVFNTIPSFLKRIKITCFRFGKPRNIKESNLVLVKNYYEITKFMPIYRSAAM